MTIIEQALIDELVTDLVAGHPAFVLSGEQCWDAALWSDLDATGLTELGDSDDPGAIPTVVSVIVGLARGAAAVPLAEHALVARPMLAAAGYSLPPAEGVTTLAAGSVRAERAGGHTWAVSGRAMAPWLTIAEHVLLLAEAESGPIFGLATAADLTKQAGVNAAGEPRDTLVLEHQIIQGAPVDLELVEVLRAKYALARAAQMLGALQEILVFSVRYARERQQFGRSIGSFQAIQFMVADIAEEVALVSASVRAAANAFATKQANASALAAASKVNAGAAVDLVTANAHQIHGAIGFTQEHPLHHLTRRCWSWRDEADPEMVHARDLGRKLAAGARPGSFWANLTGTNGA